MRAGQLDRRIALQRRIETQNEYGEPVESWETYADVWSRYKAVNNSEVLEGGVEVNTVNVTFEIRYRADVSDKNRVFYQGEYYQIKAVIEIGRRRGLSLECGKITR